MDIVTSALVLLCKIRCMFFFAVEACLCALLERIIRSFSPLLPVFLLLRTYILHALPSQAVFQGEALGLLDTLF